MYQAEKIYEGVHFGSEATGAEYEQCSFNDCELTGANLAGTRFIDCAFTACDLSNALIDNTAFRTVHFKECKLLGMAWDKCNDFLLNLTFVGCQLDLSSFCSLRFKSISFTGCSLVEVDFTEANLMGCSFAECNLDRAIFFQSNLEQCDFRTAHHVIINPEQNRVRKARFSIPGALGLLANYGVEIEY